MPTHWHGTQQIAEATIRCFNRYVPAGASSTLTILDNVNKKTYSGHMKTMNISYFKAHLSQELNAVRNGEIIVIKDRNTPVADVVPHTAMPPLPVRLPLRKLSLRSLSFTVRKDPVAVLMEERGNR